MYSEKSPVNVNMLSEESQVLDNQEISINYVMAGKRWNQNEIDVDDIFAYHIARNFVKYDEDHELKYVYKYRQTNDWPMGKDVIDAELKSLTKHKVFGHVVRTPEVEKPIGYKWVFVRKQNEKNEIVRYKARLIAHGLSQRPEIDYEETYSPVVNATTFQYLLSLTIHERLEMRLMDIVTAYLYGSFDNDIYMKHLKGLKLQESYYSGHRELYSIKLCRSI